VATATFRSTVAQDKTISATINSVAITQTAAVTVDPAAVSAAQSSVAAAPGTITASTGSSTSTITVTVRDEFSNPIQGAGVVLSSTGANNTFVQPGNTNSLGVTTGTFRSTMAEGKTISATADGTLITQTAAVTVNPAGVSAAQSAVGASPGTITASNGSSASTITVTVRDQFNNPIPGAAVVLSATPTTGNTLTQPASNTNSSGVATGTLSSTSAESKTASATAQVGAGPIVPITQTAGVTVNPAAADHFVFTVQPSNTTAGNAMNPAVVVTVLDQFGNTANFNGTVTLTVAGGGSGISGNSVTASAGVASFGSLILDTPGTYNLDVDGGGLPTVQSSSFDIL
jgi:adhesin/invasin